MGGNPTCEPSRQAKHDSIMHSIETLRKTRRQVQGLLDEIAGTNSEKEEDTAHPPALSFMLNNAASFISEECERINALITKIQEELF